MTSAEPGKNMKFSSPGCYRICVKGFVDESWSERLGGLHIDNQFYDKNLPVAVIEGMIKDQTEMIGILNSLYEMHLSLISVNFIGSGENDCC